jgi:hypothetical protein
VVEAVVEKAPEVATVEAVVDGADGADVPASADAKTDDEKDDGLIEDASELGEDEDDMADVIEGIEPAASAS